jgi:hypothetical protein
MRLVNGHEREGGWASPRGAQPRDEGTRSSGEQPRDRHPWIGTFRAKSFSASFIQLTIMSSGTLRTRVDTGCRKGGPAGPRLRTILVDRLRAENKDRPALRRHARLETADGNRMVIVWWLEMPSTPGAGDLWSPMRASGPTSGADPRSIIFVIFAMLCPLLTITSRGIMILIFEVCISDCPKSWSGLLALAAARVLGISLGAAHRRGGGRGADGEGNGLCSTSRCSGAALQPYNSHTVILVCVCCFSFTCRLLRPSPSKSGRAPRGGTCTRRSRR